MKRKAGPELTDFQRRVYEVVSRIPPGRVATYRQVAAQAGCGCSRAVGQALRRNPFAPRVPCHRVIASDLRPGGFAGHARGPEVQRKLALLAAEGVEFAGDRLVDPRKLFTFGRNRA